MKFGDKYLHMLNDREDYIYGCIILIVAATLFLSLIIGIVIKPSSNSEAVPYLRTDQTITQIRVIPAYDYVIRHTDKGGILHTASYSSVHIFDTDFKLLRCTNLAITSTIISLGIFLCVGIIILYTRYENDRFHVVGMSDLSATDLLVGLRNSVLVLILCLPINIYAYMKLYDTYMDGQRIYTDAVYAIPLQFDKSVYTEESSLEEKYNVVNSYLHKCIDRGTPQMYVIKSKKYVPYSIKDMKDLPTRPMTVIDHVFDKQVPPDKTVEDL